MDNKERKLKTSIVFLYCGQVQQWNNMGLELYNNNKVFKDTIDYIDTFLKDNYFNGKSMLNELRSLKDDELNYRDQFMVHSALFMLQAGLFELFKSNNINPSIIHGVSCGEIAAAYCSGMIDLENTCKLIYDRARLNNKVVELNPGRMGLIEIHQNEYIDKYSKQYPNIEVIGTFSGLNVLVGTGDIDQFELLYNNFTEKGITVRKSLFETTFHTSLSECIKEDALSINIKSKSPTTKIFSLEGNLFNENYLFNSEYLYKNLRYPLKTMDVFKNIFNHLESENNDKVIFVELSPTPTISKSVFNFVSPSNLNSSKFTSTSNDDPSNNIIVLSSLEKGKNDLDCINNTIEIIKKNI